MELWIPHEQGRATIGDLPAAVNLQVWPGGDAPFPGDPAGVEFWVPPFLAQVDAVPLAGKMRALKAIQLLSAGAEIWVGRVPESVTLCDARGVHDSPTAEWVVGAILAVLREFPGFARAQGERRWSYADYTPTDELAGKRVLVVGAGSIGAAIRARLLPFEVELTMVARRARPDEGVHGVDELPELLPRADVAVLVVPLTDATRGMVDRAFLAALPDGALLVNAARGPVADTGALAAELGTGRIRAALDVTDPEPLPPDHPLWTMPNVFISPHTGGSVRGLLPRAYRLVADQVRRYAAGEPLINQVADGY